MHFYKNIKLLYIAIFFHNLIPAYVIERLFWQERGMNVKMVVYCEIIYALTIIILEIPSGILADKFGRKNLILIGSILAFFEFIILIFAYNFWQFAFVVFLTGIGGACTSGAWNALLYDSLVFSKMERDFQKVLGHIEALDFLASLIAALSGGVLAGLYDFRFNYMLSAFSAMISLIAVLFLKEPKREHFNKDNHNKVRSILKQSIEFFSKNLNITSMIIHVAVISACINYIYEFWQIYLNYINIPVAFFGIVSAILTIVRIPGAIIANWLTERFNRRDLIFFLSSMVAIGLLISAFIKSLTGVLAMSMACFSYGIMELVVIGKLHHEIDNDFRATIDSAGSFMRQFFSAMLGLIFAYVSDTISIFAGFMILGLSCFVATYIFKFIYKKLRI